jgi:hypothetical protein
MLRKKALEKARATAAIARSTKEPTTTATNTPQAKVDFDKLNLEDKYKHLLGSFRRSGRLGGPSLDRVCDLFNNRSEPILPTHVDMAVQILENYHLSYKPLVPSIVSAFMNIAAPYPLKIGQVFLVNTQIGTFLFLSLSPFSLFLSFLFLSLSLSLSLFLIMLSFSSSAFHSFIL